MFIIFGTRGVTYTRDRGTFHCPSCSSRQQYATKGVRRFFTLFFIPILPLDLLGVYVECERCRGTFKEEVLSYDPEAESIGAAATAVAMFQVVIRRVMVLMMMADRRIEAKEIETIQKIYGRISGTYLSDAEVREDITKAKETEMGVVPFLRTAMPFLNNNGKEAVVKAAFMVAASDGVLQDEEKDFMGQAANALEMSQAHFRGILTELTRPELADARDSSQGRIS